MCPTYIGRVLCRADEMEAPPAPWLQRFDKPSRLLLHTLTSGPRGALAAFRALQRIRACDEPGQAFHWQIFTETLCAEEPVLRGPERTLTLRPILLLLPVLCQRNLFSLLHIVQGSMPKDCLSQLLQATRKDPSPDLWVQALRDLLQRGLREERSCWTPLPLTDTCRQQLKTLCQKIVGGTQSKPDLERKQSWFIQEKRKQVAEESLDPEGERQRKRSRLEEDEEDEIGIEASGHVSIQSQTRGANENTQPDAIMETREASQGSQRDAAAKVPDFIQVPASQTDGTAPPELQILHECTPGQGLCSLLQLSECPERALVHFCTWLLAVTPELSYTNAAVLTEQLFLQRVLSLTQPASRHLMAALTSFCSKYARQVCCALIAPALQAPGAGEFTASSLGHLVSEVTLVPCILLHVMSTSLFQVELPPELFNLLVLKLCQLAQAFAKSMNYTKLMMAVLTMYSSNVTHQRHLSGALDLNHTALRKSLQACLEQMSPR
uniref:Fanconi Anaemia group E protein C-terminal domain-containing protein n=1 Tax=Chelydra serpentina TaxID=8475 RepID=A0A8C3S2H3_CHESE